MFKIISKAGYEAQAAEVEAYKRQVDETNELVEAYLKQNDEKDELIKTLQEANEQLCALREANAHVAQTRENEVQALNEEVSMIRSHCEELEEKLRNSTISDDENTVTLVISDDMVTIKPIIRYNEDAPENLMQSGLLSDARSSSEFAVQLALMTIAHDSLAQIIESFEEDIDNE